MALNLLDSTSNHRDLTVSLGSAIDSTDIPTVPGNTNSASLSVSTQIDMSDFTSIDSSDFTIETWIKQGGTTDDRIIANKGGASGLNLYIQDNDKVVCQINSTSTTSVASVTDITWIHIAFVFTKSAGTVDLYKNGAFVETLSSLSTGGIPNNSSVLYFSTPSSTTFLVDERRIWSVARSSGNISANYNVRIDPATAGLVAYYQFDNPGGGRILKMNSKYW